MISCNFVWNLHVTPPFESNNHMFTIQIEQNCKKLQLLLRVRMYLDSFLWGGGKLRKLLTKYDKKGHGKRYDNWDAVSQYTIRGITPSCRGAGKPNFWKGGNPNLPTKKTCLKTNFPTKEGCPGIPSSTSTIGTQEICRQAK